MYRSGGKNSCLKRLLMLDRCQCDGLCAREHTGLGALAAGSHYPTKFHLIDGKLLCSGCREPYDPNKRWVR